MKTLIKNILENKSIEQAKGLIVRLSSMYAFTRAGYDHDVAWLLGDVGLVVTISRGEGITPYKIALHSCSVNKLDFSNPIVTGETHTEKAMEIMVVALLNFDVPKYMLSHFRNATVDMYGLIFAPVSGKKYSLMWAQSDQSLARLNTTSQFTQDPTYDYNIVKFSSGIAFYGVQHTKLINIGPVMRRDTEMDKAEFEAMTQVASTFKYIVNANDVVPGQKVSANGFVYYAARLTKNSVECLDADDLEYIYFDRDTNPMALLENTVE